MAREANNTKEALNWTPQADSPEISPNTNWTKLLLVGRARRSILRGHVKYMLHVRSETRYTCKSCVLLHEVSWFVK
jgi:hypothetical protein